VSRLNTLRFKILTVCVQNPNTGLPNYESSVLTSENRQNFSVHNELTKWSEACRFILRWVLEVRFLTSVNVSWRSVNNARDLWIRNDRVTATSPTPCFHLAPRKCRVTIGTNPMKMKWRIEFFDLVQRHTDRWWNLSDAELLLIGCEAERFGGMMRVIHVL